MANNLAPYEKGGRLIRLFGWFYIVVTVAWAIFAVVVQPSGEGETAMLIVMGLIFLGSGLIFLFVGKAVKEYKTWGRIAGIILAAVSLLQFPLGTLFGVLVFRYLGKGWNERTKPVGQKPGGMDWKKDYRSETHTCPKCGYNSDTAFGECPKCQVVVGKFLQIKKIRDKEVQETKCGRNLQSDRLNEPHIGNSRCHENT